ncbi:hypothetical protein ANCCEY_09862 [Ancylostoma ceylanicum]|uniref:RNA-dependent RNA polymerase n=1 Tax=Ancylostoma ceylanicum TaxID=53326 RepID=A0A0D6LLW7_9BILA|nr:hypothetical protein ANCCEY_09862 [Ancylostoma ceylanicum]
MRDHGCYMYASTLNRRTGDKAMTVEDMREWMGDFSSSKNVPKLMSRMGQCFTQAQHSLISKPALNSPTGTRRTSCDHVGANKRTVGASATPRTRAH